MEEYDHRKLGQELDLFTFSDLVGSGLPLWTPRGTILRQELDAFIWEMRATRGYERVAIPHITKKDLYEASPIAKYKSAGVPTFTVAGVIFTAFLVFLLYEWLLDPNALYGIGYSINPNGAKNITSLVFMGALYVIALVIYLVTKSYRKSRGVDIDKIYKEIPVE